MKAKTLFTVFILSVLLLSTVNVQAITSEETLPGLTISEVTIAGERVTEGNTSSTINAGDEVTVEFTVTNTFDRPITGIRYALEGGITVEPSERFNLAAGASETISFTSTLDVDQPEGNIGTRIAVQGEDSNDRSLINNDFRFRLAVDRAAADVEITNVRVQHETLTCEARTAVIVDFANFGSNHEDDIKISLTGLNEITREKTNIRLNEGETSSVQFRVPASAFDSGSNQITALLNYRTGFYSDSQTFTITKADCLATTSPSESSIILATGNSQEFTADVTEATATTNIVWTVTLDGERVDRATGTTYTFEEEEGIYTVTLTVNGVEADSWTVQVTDVPLSSTATVTTEDGKTTIENSQGKIVFDNTVDFGDNVDLDKIVSITANQVAIDTENAPGLDEPATVTLKRTFTNEFEIQQSSEYRSGSFIECSSCRVLSNTNGQFTFTVTGFSTYRVVEVQPAMIELANINLPTTTRGESVSVDVTVTNSGTVAPLTNVQASFTIDAAYQASFSGFPTTIPASSSATGQLTITLPEDEDGGQKQIGTFTVTSNEDSETVTVFSNAASALMVTKVEINGKTSGDLEIDDSNEIEVFVENTLDIDMEDVDVEVRLDLGDDELDESESIDNLDAGEEDDIKVTFDLTNEDIEDETLTLEIEVTGRAEDGSRHTTVETRTIDLDLESHKLSIERVTLTPSTVNSNGYGNIQVTVKNLGSHDEDEVEVRVYNSALGINFNRDEIEIDKFTDTNNDERITFNFALDNVDAGVYPLTIEALLDGDLEDSETVTLTVREDGTTQVTSQQQQQYTDNSALAQQLQQQLAAQLASQQTAQSGNTVTGTFRETSTYTVLLIVLIVLVVFALLLLMAVAVKKRR